MEQLSFKISNFEGPLDLLLHLISKHKMQICEVSIAELIDQYLESIGRVGPDELDPTSEFLEMAARLVYMKSLALLPRQEETEALEKELVGQLVEYSLCKQAASKLADMSQGLFFAVREPMTVEFDEEYNITHEPETLLEAYLGTMGKNARLVKPRAEDFDEIVSAPVVSVNSRIIRILRGLKRGTARTLSDLFKNVAGKSEAVATFLGVLELVKAGRMKIADDGALTGVNRAARERMDGNQNA